MGKLTGQDCARERAAMALDAPFGDLAALDPSGVDTLWAQERRPLEKAEHELSALQRTARRYRKHGQPVPGYVAEGIEGARARIAAENARLAPFAAEWERRGGWSRALLVTNADGHIHSSTACPTLRPSTLIAWLPELSGATEEQIIAHAGHMACTVCYPDAPAHPSFIAGAEQAAKDAESRQAARCPGSGQHPADPDWRRRYQPCPECGGMFGTSPAGKLRPHKPPAG